MSADGSESRSFRQATLDDAPAMLAVLEAAFERWPAFDISVPALEHLLWKMQPPGIEPNHTVGEIDGEIIALELRWMGKALLDGREVMTNDGADMAVHPNFQGRGFSRRINEAPLAHSAGRRPRHRHAEPQPANRQLHLRGRPEPHRSIGAYLGAQFRPTDAAGDRFQDRRLATGADAPSERCKADDRGFETSKGAHRGPLRDQGALAVR